jgi:hypothetical protein
MLDDALLKESKYEVSTQLDHEGLAQKADTLTITWCYTAIRSVSLSLKSWYTHGEHSSVR